MNLNLTDSELKSIVKTHVNNLIGVSENRLKVTFTRRQTQTDTSVEILEEGQQKSIIQSEQEEVSQDEIKETKIYEPEEDQSYSDSKYK